MKGKIEVKTVILFIMAVCIFVLAGCQSEQRDKAFFDDDIPMDRRIGEIRSLGGVKTESQGTHILQLDNGDTVLLKSIAINLDDAKYKGQTVEVRGVLTYTKDSKSLMEVMNIDILEQYEAKEAVKAKWVTYNGADFNFSIKYRDDFTVRERARGVTFEIPDTSNPVKEETAVTDEEVNASDQGVANTDIGMEDEPVVHLVMIDVESRSKEKDLHSKLELEGDTSEELLKAGLTMSKIGADGLMAYKSEYMDGAGLAFYVENADYIYTITFEAGADSGYLEARNIFYEMLGTFKIKGGTLTATDESGADEGDKEVDLENNQNEDDGSLDFEGGDNFDDEDGSADEDAEADADDTEVADGFNVFENETFEFSIQYPKNWYYSGVASSESNVVRRYEFGDEPTDKKSGNVYLDVYKGSIPDGSVAGADGNITIVTEGGTVELYIEGENRNFRLSGPDSLKGTLLYMAKTLE